MRVCPAACPFFRVFLFFLAAAPRRLPVRAVSPTTFSAWGYFFIKCKKTFENRLQTFDIYIRFIYNSYNFLFIFTKLFVYFKQTLKKICKTK